jgi:hypothetical protein
MAVKVTKKPQEKPQTNEIKEESPPVEFVEFENEPALQVLIPRDCPPFPAKTITADREGLFWKWIDSLTQEDWNHLTIYCYRDWPLIDRTRDNPNAAKYIDKYGSRFTKEILMKGDGADLIPHGSGKYILIVNDANKAVKGKGGQIGQAHISINDVDHPPLFRLEELVVEHPNNRSIVDKLVAEGKLNPQGKIMQTQGGTDNAALIGLVTSLINKLSSQPQQAPKDSTAESISQMFVKANDTMLGMVKDQAKSDDPEKLIKMLSTLKEMLPKAESGNATLELIVKMQAEMTKLQMESTKSREELMLKMMEMMQAKNSSGEDEFDKTLERQIKLKELMGGESGGADRKKSIPELAFEYGAPVAIKLFETIQGFINVRNYSEGLKKQQAQGNTPQAHQQQQAGLPSVTQEQPQTNQEAGKVVEMPATPEHQLIGIIRGPAGPLIIAALQRGDTGDMFAENLEGMFGRMTYDQIATLGKDQILAAMQSIPEFWSQIVPSSVEKFVEDFINLDQIRLANEQEGE